MLKALDIGGLAFRCSDGSKHTPIGVIHTWVVPDYFTFSLSDVITAQDLLDKVARYQFRSDADKLWQFLANFIYNGSREFFVEWTDHGLKHIESVFNHAQHLISPEASNALTPEDVACLITSILLHDVAMRFDTPTLSRILESPDEVWRPLQDCWRAFIAEVQHWDPDEIASTYGDDVVVPKSTNIRVYAEANKKVVGEFLRRHHADLCALVVANGFKDFGVNDPFVQAWPLADDQFRTHVAMSGRLAKSHNHDLRNSADDFGEFYAKGLPSQIRSTVSNIHYAYCMAVLRLSDYLDFRHFSAQSFLAHSMGHRSPISQLEQRTMVSYSATNWNSTTMEVIGLECTTSAPDVYNRFKDYCRGIQKELDSSWAVISEHYASTIDSDLALKGLTGRRVALNNVGAQDLEKRFYTEPLRISVRDSSVIYLLAEPLYNSDPRFAIREILSNAHDACLEAESDVPAGERPVITFEIEDGPCRLRFSDTGCGMSFDEVRSFFLRVGGRLRGTVEWKALRTKQEVLGSTYAFTSRFGVGVVSLFMLGGDVQMTTRKRGCDGLRLRIGRNLGTLLAERIDAKPGTILEIEAEPNVLNKLIRFLDDVKENSNDFVQYLLRCIDFLKFIPFEFDIHLKRKKLVGEVDLRFPSLREWLEGSEVQWVPLLGCDGAMCVIAEADCKFRESLLVYNGIPIERRNTDRHHNTTVLFISDPTNSLSFNLQKTELDGDARPLIDNCFKSYCLGVLDTLATSSPLSLFTGIGSSTAGVPMLPLYLEALEAFETSERLFPKKSSDGTLPLVFFANSHVLSLTDAAIKMQSCDTFMMMGVVPERLPAALRQLRPEVPTVIFLLGQYGYEPPYREIELRDVIRWKAVSNHGKKKANAVLRDRKRTTYDCERLLRNLGLHKDISTRKWAREALDFAFASEASGKGTGIVLVERDQLLRFVRVYRQAIAEVAWSRPDAWLREWGESRTALYGDNHPS